MSKYIFFSSLFLYFNFIRLTIKNHTIKNLVTVTINYTFMNNQKQHKQITYKNQTMFSLSPLFYINFIRTTIKNCRIQIKPKSTNQRENSIFFFLSNSFVCRYSQSASTNVHSHHTSHI